jgi:hypothetical protein
MAAPDDDKPGAGPDADANLRPEERLQKVLESRWDPGKLSKFMRSSAGSKGTRLDAHQRGFFEKRLGVDLGDVRIYTGELAEEITKAHGAEALTVGDTGIILMRQSAKFQAGSAAHTALLAHELTHVAQNRPDAIARKATSASGQVEEEEQEAEHHEAEVFAELTGQAGSKPSEGDKDQAKRDRKEKLLGLVMKVFEEEDWLQPMRFGTKINKLV